MPEKRKRLLAWDMFYVNKTCHLGQVSFRCSKKVISAGYACAHGTQMYILLNNIITCPLKSLNTYFNYVNIYSFRECKYRVLLNW